MNNSQKNMYYQHKTNRWDNDMTSISANKESQHSKDLPPRHPRNYLLCLPDLPLFSMANDCQNNINDCNPNQHCTDRSSELIGILDMALQVIQEGNESYDSSEFSTTDNHPSRQENENEPMNIDGVLESRLEPLDEEDEIDVFNQYQEHDAEDSFQIVPLEFPLSLEDSSSEHHRRRSRTSITENHRRELLLDNAAAITDALLALELDLLPGSSFDFELAEEKHDRQ